MFHFHALVGVDPEELRSGLRDYYSPFSHGNGARQLTRQSTDRTAHDKESFEKLTGMVWCTRSWGQEDQAGMGWFKMNDCLDSPP